MIIGPIRALSMRTAATPLPYQDRLRRAAHYSTRKPGSRCLRAWPQPSLEPRGTRDRARDRVTNGLLRTREDEPALRPRHGGVEQLSREDPRGRVGQDDRSGLELGALALVDGHRVDGVHGTKAARADLHRPACALESGDNPLGAPLDDDARIAVVEPQLVVVVSDEQRPADEPATPRIEAFELGRQPPLDPPRPCRNAVRAAPVRAQEPV